MISDIRHAEGDGDLRACFPLMRVLRPHLTDAETFAARVRRQAEAGYRPQENLVRGPFCYVDDLVVRDDLRSSGLGARLLKAVGTEASARGLPHLVLDTALDNFLGQRFYFRFGMLPAALRFAMRLG